MFLEGTRSSVAEVLSGVTQGTVLGPLLFLAFINDLLDACNSSDARLFADDSLLFKTVDSIQDSFLLQQDLDALEVLEKTWQMSFNATKSSVMHIMPSKKKCLIQTTYHMHGHNLETEDASKYFGVTLDKNMNWDQHVNSVVMKGNRTLGFLRRNLKQIMHHTR